MAPNHGAEAPQESDTGARWRGLVLATLLPHVLGAQTRPMENESGVGGSQLCGRRSFARSDNQPNIVVSGQDGFGEEMRRRWDVWGGC